MYKIFSGQQIFPTGSLESIAVVSLLGKNDLEGNGSIPPPVPPFADEDSTERVTNIITHRSSGD